MKKFLYILFFPFYLVYWFIKSILNIFKNEKAKHEDGRGFRIYIAGIQYKNDDGTDRQLIIKKCRKGEELLLVRTSSKYDDCGIRICRKNGECLGWVPAKFSYEFTSEMERGIEISAFFHSLIKPERDFNFYGARVTIVKR